MLAACRGASAQGTVTVVMEGLPGSFFHASVSNTAILLVSPVAVYI